MIKAMTCSHCGSENVRRDAWAEWHYGAQEWQLAEVFDYAYCLACEGETTIKEIETEEWPGPII